MRAPDAILLLACAFVACQARVGLATLAPDWASQLVLEDPASVFPENVWSMIDQKLYNERELIYQKMVSGKLAEAIQHARDLISKLARQGNAPQMLLFKQTIFMLKIKAEAMNRQYLEAMLDGVRYSSFCAGLAQNCPNVAPIGKLLTQLEQSIAQFEDRTEILGLGADELSEVAKLKKHREKTLHMLHQRQNAYMSAEHLKYVKVLYDWAETAYTQMLDYVTQTEAAKKAEQSQAKPQSWANSFRRPTPSQTNRTPQPEFKAEARPSSHSSSHGPGYSFKPANSWNKPARPAAQDSTRPSPRPTETARPQPAVAARPVQPARVMKNVDPALMEKRAFIESKLNANQLSECITLAQELINGLNEDTAKEADLVDFKQSVYELKIKAEVKNRQYLLAMLDSAKFISYCANAPGGCPNVYVVKQMQDQISKSIESANNAEFLGLNAKEVTDKQVLKKGQRDARLLLHPDRNRDLEEEQKRFIGNVFDRANRAYQELLAV